MVSVNINSLVNMVKISIIFRIIFNLNFRTLFWISPTFRNYVNTINFNLILISI